MILPTIKDFDFQGKKVLVRVDVDVPLQKFQSGKDAKMVRREIEDDTRIKECLPTIRYLLNNGAEVILMGHLGRPEGKVAEELRLSSVAQKLQELLKSKVKIQKSIRQLADKIQNFLAYQISESIVLLENLRFDPREENNDVDFAKELAGSGEFYVNEAFAASHREHASIVGIPKFLPSCAGLHFSSEVENLSKVLESPKRPLVFVIGGAKPETKLPLVEELAKKADWVLVGGTLCKKSKVKSQSASWRTKFKSIIFADLTEDRLDINNESIKKFTEIVKTAGTVVWNGPMGKYEDERWPHFSRLNRDSRGKEVSPAFGTWSIAQTIAESSAFKVVGGGDTIAALKKFGLLDKIDYVSSGGGAMLEFLAKGTLPGIKALL